MDKIRRAELYLRIFGARKGRDSVNADTEVVIPAKLCPNFTSCFNSNTTLVDMSRRYYELLLTRCLEREKSELYIEKMTDFPEMSQATSLLLMTSQWKESPLSNEDHLRQELSILNYLAPPLASDAASSKEYRQEASKARMINFESDLGGGHKSTHVNVGVHLRKAENVG